MGLLMNIFNIFSQWWYMVSLEVKTVTVIRFHFIMHSLNVSIQGIFVKTFKITYVTTQLYWLHDWSCVYGVGDGALSRLFICWLLMMGRVKSIEKRGQTEYKAIQYICVSLYMHMRFLNTEQPLKLKNLFPLIFVRQVAVTLYEMRANIAMYHCI